MEVCYVLRMPPPPELIVLSDEVTRVRSGGCIDDEEEDEYGGFVELLHRGETVPRFFPTAKLQRDPVKESSWVWAGKGRSLACLRNPLVTLELWSGEFGDANVLSLDTDDDVNNHLHGRGAEDFDHVEDAPRPRKAKWQVTCLPFSFRMPRCHDLKSLR